MPSSPTAARLEFSLRIRARRQELGLSAESVAKAIGVSRVYFSSIENSRTTLADAKLPDLFDALSLTKPQQEDLRLLLSEARRPGWWAPFAKYCEDSFLDFVGLEHSASRLAIYESRLITGLLQIPDYATATIEMDHESKPADLAAHVEIRLRRQELLKDPRGPEVHLIMSETALNQVYGSLKILQAQLQHLESVIVDQEDRVSVRIQPFSTTPLGIGHSSTVVLISFDSQHLPDLAWEEGGSYMTLYTEPAQISRIKIGYKHLARSTLSERDSLALIRSRIAALQTPEPRSR